MPLYTTAQEFYGTPPGWINATDGARLASYEFYKALFKNDPTTFKVTLRDDEENPVYIPSAKRIVRTMARYTCRDLGFAPVAISVGGAEAPAVTPEDQLQVITAYGDLFNREEFFANFRDAMEMGIAQGDFCLMVSGDPNKPEGSRLTLRFIDPGTYHARRDPADGQRISGCMVVERIYLNDKGEAGMPDSTKEYIKRQRWVKVTDPVHPAYAPPPAVPNYETPIQYDSMILETKDWEDPAKIQVFRTDVPMVEIPNITALPIYHFRNRGEVGEVYGVSELEGFERLFMAINQAATDEDVALAMQGLGLYVSSAKFVNEDGEEVDPVLGPRRVVTLSGPGKAADQFSRVSGVTDVSASQDHIGFLVDSAESTSGISDVALGQVDTTVAESGIALAIRMGPIFDESGRKDDRILSKLKQFMYDLKAWFQEYESITIPDGIGVEPVVGPKLPVDVDKQLARLQDLYVNGIIPTRLYIVKLNELGLDLGDPKALMAELEAEAAARLQREQDALGGQGDGRLEDEAGDGADDPAADEPAS